jgi:dipeptidyl-peptidase-4
MIMKRKNHHFHHALGLPCLLLAGLTAVCLFADGGFAVERPQKAPAGRVGWVDTVKLDLEGWTVHADARLVSGEHQELGAPALKMLANHLQRISILVPKKQLADLRRMEIFIEHEHPELRAMQYHPGEEWLTERGYDPRLARKVHITQASELLSRDQMLKHPAVILHELAHAYHDQILGFDEPGIIEAYGQAMKNGTYDKVLLYDGKIVKHYATTNHKEYFAEATEAYFYRNDFYPFVRAELRQHDSAGFSQMERIWGGKE